LLDVRIIQGTTEEEAKAFASPGATRFYARFNVALSVRARKRNLTLLFKELVATAGGS